MITGQLVLAGMKDASSIPAVSIVNIVHEIPGFTYMNIFEIIY